LVGLILETVVTSVKFVMLESTTMRWVVKTAKIVVVVNIATAVQKVVLNHVLNAFLVNIKAIQEERRAFNAHLANINPTQRP